jgi:uncharacterized membrane protein
MALGGAVGATAAGAGAGAVTGYLKDQGMDQQLAMDYDATMKDGGAFIAVTVPSGNVDEIKANEIMNKYGATNVKSFASTAGGYLA